MTIDTSREAVERLLKNVTPGPWRVGPVDDCRVEDADGNEVSQIDGDYNHPDLWPIMEANARFISASRELVPALLARAEAAEAEVARLTAERDAALASSARAVVMGVWGMCEAIEDDAHEKIAMADCDHSKGFWTGQKLAAKTIRRSTEMPAQTTSTVQDALAVRVKVKSLVWCDGCRAVGAIHCSDPENCGYMVSAEAAADSWKAWLDDLPLPEDFAVGIGRLGDFIDRIVANAIVEPPSQPITVQDAAQVPEIAALIKAAKDRDGGSHDEDCRIHRKYREPVHCNCGHDDLDAALRAIAEQDPKK